jgi:hypothetical protein
MRKKSVYGKREITTNREKKDREKEKNTESEKRIGYE